MRMCKVKLLDIEYICIYIISILFIIYILYVYAIYVQKNHGKASLYICLG